MQSIHLRLLGYTVTLVVHVVTGVDVLNRLSITTKDPIVADFAGLQLKFMTIWTYLLQMFYVTLGLSCDLLNLFSQKIEEPKAMNKFRETLFSALVWPTSLYIPTIFWPLYLSDNRLVFPPFIDKVLSPSNNQVMHTYVAFFALWELIFLKRRERNHKLNVTLLAGVLMVYLWVLFESYLERGSFIYPVLDRALGTIYFPLIIFTGLVLPFLYYSIQWYLISFLWESREKTSSKKNR